MWTNNYLHKGTSKNAVYLAHVIANCEERSRKQSRGERHNVNFNSGLLRSARNDVSEINRACRSSHKILVEISPPSPVRDKILVENSNHLFPPSPVRDVILVKSNPFSPTSPVRDVIDEKIYRPLRDLAFGWLFFSTNIQSLTGQKRTNIFYKKR